MSSHPFWWILSIACVVWYSTITVYVAIRGMFDIRTMLERLAAINEEEARGSDDR